MSNFIDFDKAKDVLGSYTAQAQEMLKDATKVENALQSLEKKMKEIPTVGEGLSKLPLMISMIRGYITKEYTDVSPKVIASMLCAVLYLLTGKDLIRDNIPVVGYLDDIAVVAAAFKLSENELAAYEQWRNAKMAAAAEPALEAAETVVRQVTEAADESAEAIEAMLDNAPSEA
jgi:uncharacterized membrane protein YkvA (DUF1232 family)